MSSSPGMGKNFSFCNSRFSLLAARVSPKSTVTYSQLIPCFRNRFARKKYGCRFQWFITFHVSFNLNLLNARDTTSVIQKLKVNFNYWIAARNNWTRTNVILKFPRACAGHCLLCRKGKIYERAIRYRNEHTRRILQNYSNENCL